MIRFACPSCEKVFKVPDSAGGKAAACTQCGIRFLIPNPPAPVAPPPPPPPPVPDVLDAEVVEESPPPPSPSKLIIPMPLEPCPTCGAVLTVTTDDLGLPVECPFCRTMYVCVARKAVPPVETKGSHSSLSLSSWAHYPPFAPPTPAVNFALSPPPPVVPVPLAPPPEPPAIEIAPCPKCRAELTVAPEAVGGDVECPFCKTVYKAESPKPKEGTVLARVVRRNPTTQASAPPPEDGKKPYRFKRRSDEDDEDDDRPRRRRR